MNELGGCPELLIIKFYKSVDSPSSPGSTDEAFTRFYHSIHKDLVKAITFQLYLRIQAPWARGIQHLRNHAEGLAQSAFVNVFGKARKKRSGRWHPDHKTSVLT